MVSVRNATALVLCQLIVFWGYVAAVNYGSDTVVSVVTPLNITGPDNKINTFACLKNGFGFADAATTCSFASTFPVAGPVYLRGGTLYLQSDLILTNTGSLADLGRIKGQQHAVDLPESVSGFASGTQASGAIVLNLLARITASRTIYSADWSYDGKYVAYGISTGSGSDLYVYEFTGTSLVLRASVNVASNGFSVRWSPNGYVIAVGAGYTVRTYKFTPPSSLSYADSEAPGGNYYAVSWQGRGRYLAAGGYNTTNSYIRIYSVDSNGAMSLVTTNTNNTTAQFNGSITYDVLKWAPTGNKDDIIAGSSGGSLHLYNFTGAALNHLKNYQQGINITSLDWASTSTYLALGFSNGNVKTYQHTAATNAIAAKTTYAGIGTRTRSVNWKNTALELLVGFNYSANQSEFQVLNFNTSSYALSRAYSIDLTNNVSCVRYSPNGLYIARTDDTTRYLSVYKTSYSPLVFEDVKLYLTGNITVGSPLTFKGDCILNARSNLITVTGDGAINVAKDSTLDIEQAYLNFTAPNAFALEGGTSNVKFRNTWLELGSDVLWGDGKFDSYEDLTITGPYVFDYESAYTSTIHSNSTVTFQKGATFKIGKTTQEVPEPLLFEDSASQLSFDNATFHVTGSGLKATKGTINIYNESTFDIDHTDTNLSATMQGLWVGDSVRGSEYDAGLVIHGNGSSLSVKNGAIILDSVSPYRNQFLGQSHIIIKNNCTVYVKRPADMSNGWLSTDETTSLVFDPNSYLLCNNTYFTNLLYNLRYEDYYLTGTLQAMDGIDLSENSLLNLNTGLLLQVINVIGGNNTIAGVGRFQGLLNFVDSNSSLIWDLTQSLELYDHVYLNGGRIQFTQDSALLNSLTFKTTGTVDITSKSLYLGNQYSEWDGNIYWIADGGTLRLQNDVYLSGIWTFSGDTIIDGFEKTLLFEEGGKIVLERGAHVTFKDLLIENLSDDNPILCSDDTSNITFDYTDIALSGDYTFDKGSFTIYNDTWISSLGTSDVMYTFSYESTKTSTIDEMAFLKIGPRARFSIGREDSSVIDPEQQPLVFVDASSPLILDSGNLHITSSGMIFTKGVLRIQGDSHLEIENQKYDFGLILGDGVNVGNDYQLEITSGARVGIETGKLVYNNYADDEINFGSLESALNIVAWQGLVPQRSMHLMNGTVTTPNAGDVFIVESSGSYVIGDNLHRYDYGRGIDYYVTGTLFVSDGIREIILDSGDQVVTNPGAFAVNLSIISDGNKISGIGNVTGALNFADYNSTLTWDINQVYGGGDINLSGGRIIYTKNSGIIGQSSLVGTGTVDLTTRTFELGSENSTWSSNIYWIGDGGTIHLNNDIVVEGTWTLSGNVIVSGDYTIDLAPSGKIVLERGAQVTFQGLSLWNISRKNPLVCSDDNCVITLNYMDFMMAGDYEFDKGSLYVYWDSTIGTLGDLDTAYTFSYTSKMPSLIDAYCTLEVLPQTIFAIGRSDSMLSAPDEQPLTFGDATAKLLLNSSTLHVTSSGMMLTKGELAVSGGSVLEVENDKIDYGLILGDGTPENDQLLRFRAGGQLTLKSGKLVYNNYTPDRIIFDSPSSTFAVESQYGLYAQRNMILTNGSVATPPTINFLDYEPGVFVETSNLNRYDYSHLLDYYVTGTLALLPIRSVVLDTNDQLLINPGTFPIDIFIEQGGNKISGIGSITAPLHFADYHSTLSWDINQKYSGGDITLNGGRIIYTQDSGLDDGYSFVGTGTVDLTTKTFELGTETATWHGDLYWISNGATLKLNNNVTLDGTWTFSGDVVIEGKNFLIDLAPSGKIVLERGASVSLKDISLYNVSRRNPVVCSDDNCVISMSVADILMVGDYEFDKGSLFVYWNSTIGRLGDLDTSYTFSYTSGMPSYIDTFCSLKIWPGTVFAIGRKDSTITDPDLQPLTFGDATSQLILDGSTLHVTSSGMMLTKGVVNITGDSHIKVDNSKYEYSLVLGDGTEANDFGNFFAAEGKLTIDTGKVFYNNYQADRIVFENISSTLGIDSVGGLTLNRDMTLQNGYLAFGAAGSLGVLNGSRLIESGMTHIHISPYSVHKVKDHGIDPYRLENGDYFYQTEGITLSDIVCVSGSSAIGGTAGIFSPVILNNHTVSVRATLLPIFFDNIVLNGGTVELDTDMSFVADKKVTGSGTIEFAGTTLTLGAADLTFTDTQYLNATTPSTLSLRGKTRLFGTWKVNGNLHINGNGNGLDLSGGGALTIRPNSIVTLENVVLLGLGQGKGNIDFMGDDSILRLTNVYIEMDNDFSTTIGGIAVNGPTVVGLKNYNWTLDQKASMTIDGVTLWQDSLSSDVRGKFTFGAGDQSKYLSLVSSGTIKTATNLDVIEQEIGTSGGDTSLQLSTIDHGPNNIHFATDSAYTLSYNLNLSSGHYLHLGGNVIVDGNGHTINLAKSSENQIVVDNNASVMLTNVKVANFSENSFNIGNNAQLIFGDGVIVELDPPEQLSETWTFSGQSWLCGVGNELQLLSGGNIIIAPNSHLTMYDLRVTGLCENNIRCRCDSAALSLGKTDLVLSSNYSFTQGSILFTGEVSITGTNVFTYGSGLTSTIDSHAVLYIDQGTTFSYSPRRAHRDLLHFDDDSSTLYLDGCSLHSTRTGLTLSGGTVVIDNKVTLSSSAAYDVEGITFDATSMINVLGSATLDVYGRIRYV